MTDRSCARAATRRPDRDDRARNERVGDGMRRPQYTIHDCCDVHVTCADCGDSHHVMRRGDETVHQARERARTVRCECEEWASPDDE
jgi:hypothetical protein